MPRGLSPLNESGQSEMEDIVSISKGEELTPRPKCTAPKAHFVNDGISELASTDPDWDMSAGDNDEDELDSTDLGTVESPLQQKSKVKSSKIKKDDKGKGKLRAAIFQGRANKQPVVRRTGGTDLLI